jgi:hypothetical protein
MGSTLLITAHQAATAAAASLRAPALRAGAGTHTHLPAAHL